MSADPTPLDDALLRYIAAHTVQEDAFLRELRAAAEAAGIPRIHISAAQASCMQLLLRLAGAREVLEVGTLFGYSALWMARALPPGGRVRSIERNPEFADFAARWAARSDVADRVEVLRGAGAELLPGIADASVDAAFMDADKQGYSGYLREFLRILRPGGLLMADNAFAFGHLLDEAVDDASVRAIRAFNEELAAHPALHAILLPLGDGFWAAVKTA